MLGFFVPPRSRVDQGVGPLAGSSTSPLPGELSRVAENAISVSLRAVPSYHRSGVRTCCRSANVQDVLVYCIIA